MNTRRRRIAMNVIGTIAAAGLIYGMAAWMADVADDSRTDSTPVLSSLSVLAPCPTEDSTGCTWYADRQGNGEGTTVTSPEGEGR